MTQRQVKMLKGGSLGLAPTLQEVVGWQYGAVLTGLNFRLRDGTWTAVVKADFPNGPQVAFVDVGGFGRCLEVTVELAGKGLLHWHRDKYPPKTYTHKKGFRVNAP